MEKEFLKRQEEILLKRKENLEKELETVAKKKKTGEKYEPKFLDVGSKEDDWAQEVQTYEEYLVLERNLAKTLSDINKSLKKIEKNTYGICENCQKEIEKDRLKIMPTASLCLSCANKPKKGFRLAFWKRG